jgi:hypothetical protein
MPLTVLGNGSGRYASIDLGNSMDDGTKVVLRKLMKLIVGNSERLVGMVAQFDEGDKGYLTEKDLVGTHKSAGYLPPSC